MSELNGTHNEIVSPCVSCPLCSSSMFNDRKRRADFIVAERRAKKSYTETAKSVFNAA